MHWAEAACMVGGVVVPLAFHTYGSLGFEATKVAVVRLLALTLVVGWVASRLPALSAVSLARLRADRSIFSSPAVLPALTDAPVGRAFAGAGVLLLATVLATLVSTNWALSLWGSYDRLQGLVTLGAWMTLGCSAHLAARNQFAGRRLVSAWLMASVPICLYALAQAVRLDPLDWLNRPNGVSGTTGSSTALGGYVAMLVPLAVMMALESTRGLPLTMPPRITRRVATATGWWALLWLLVVVSFLTTVRGALIGLVASVLVASVASIWHFRAATARWRAVSSAIVLSGFVIALIVGGSRLSDAPGLASDAGESSASQRLLIWRTSLNAVASGEWRILVGFGPETQTAALERFYPVELAAGLPNARFDRAHNLLLDQLLGSGAIGLAALIFFLGSLIALGVAPSPVLEAGERRLCIGLGGSIVAYVVSGMYAFDWMTTGTLFWLVAGLLVGVNGHGRPVAGEPGAAVARAPVAPGSPRVRVTAWLGAAALGAALVPSMIAPLMADLYHTRALALRAGEAVAQSISPQLSAVEWMPGQDVYVLALGEGYAELARTATVATGPAPSGFDSLFKAMPATRNGLFAAARFSFERAVTLAPDDPYTHYHLGRLLSTWSAADRDADARAVHARDAAIALERAAQLGPSRVLFLDESASQLARVGRFDDAVSRLTAAMSLDRPTSERLARLGDIEAGRLNDAGARTWYERALQLDQRSAAAEHGLALLSRKSGDLASAAEHGQRASRSQTRNWEYHRDLALIYLDLQQGSDALVEARSARRFAPAWEWDELTDLVERSRR